MTASDAGVPEGPTGPAPVVLIVDDEAATRILLKRTVLAVCASAQLHEASEAEAALRVADTVHPDLVLLDIVLPGSEMSGVLLCQELAKRQARVLIVSGNATGSIAQACLAMGAAGILRKPFAFEEAQAAIRGCLGQ